MKILVILFNGILPGLGHVLLGRHGAGFLHFAGFSFFANGILIATEIWRGPEAPVLFWCSVSGAGLMWTYSLGTLLYHSFFLDDERRQREVERHYTAGVQAYFENRYHEMRDELRAALHLDPSNIGARLLMAAAFREERRWRQARECLRECSRLDSRRRWQYEIQQLRGSLS